MVADFVTMKQGMDSLKGLRFKLRMMGIPMSYLTYIYGDNMSAVHNISRLESVRKKKSNSLSYHAFHELVAISESLI